MAKTVTYDTFRSDIFELRRDEVSHSAILTYTVSASVDPEFRQTKRYPLQLTPQEGQQLQAIAARAVTEAKALEGI